jgi:hypothetical protein
MITKGCTPKLIIFFISIVGEGKGEGEGDPDIFKDKVLTLSECSILTNILYSLPLQFRISCRRCHVIVIV